MAQKKWDIFCKVVDNFGDIGVSWRLARQLVAEHGLHVRLWVDDLESFQRLCPEIDPALALQTRRGVEVRHWTANDTAVADVVIEAFSCDLPASYLAAMVAKKPVWINLEYLSAEAWVSDCHGLPSPHPRLPLVKHFFFPGFAKDSGGLLREAHLLQERDAWRADAGALWASLGLPQPLAGETSVSLFCYENPVLPELLKAWAEGETALRCLIPEGRALAQAAAWLGQSLHPGEGLCKGNLSLHALPFVAQEHYDHLLWACDLNFVRGEDSFVRAQWAAKPLVWQPYPQEDGAHQVKLDAFLRRYCADLSPSAAAAARSFWQSWNGGGNIAPTWPAYRDCRGELQAHAASWAEDLAKRADLASNLVIFCEKLI